MDLCILEDLTILCQRVLHICNNDSPAQDESSSDSKNDKVNIVDINIGNRTLSSHCEYKDDCILPKPALFRFASQKPLDIFYYVCNFGYNILRKRANKKLVQNYMPNTVLCKTQLSYRSAKHYRDTYVPLLFIETIESIFQICADNTPIWNSSQITNRVLPRVFKFDGFHEINLTYDVTVKCFNSDEFPLIWSLICIKYRKVYYFGVVTEMKSNPQVDFDKPATGNSQKIHTVLSLDIIMTKPISNRGGLLCLPIEVRFITRLSNLYKMHKSLCSIESSRFINFLLTPYKSTIPSSSKTQLLLPIELNPEQKQAVLSISEDVLSNTSKYYDKQKTSISMIHGPPGTGKTKVISAIIGQIHVSHNRSWSESQPIRIIVCAPSNAAADELLLRIVKLKKEIGQPLAKLNVTRLGITKKVKKEVQKFLLDSQLKKNEKIDKLKASHIIISTLSSSYSSLTSEIYFNCCIIDEAGQCHEPEVLIPFLLKFSKLVLVGDQQQLSATILCKRALDFGLQVSMFERFYKYAFENKATTGIYQLKTQYRMHKDIVNWPSRYFYNDTLKTPNEITASRTYSIKPYFIFDLKESYEEKMDYSLRNEMEGVVIQCLLRVLYPYIKNMTVGIITPYNGQKDYLNKILYTFPKLAISTVDMFQGQEKDIIICSFVRSNNRGEIGFLRDDCRLNVALTRAKRSCFIVGNLQTLSTSYAWRSLIKNGRKRNMICPLYAKNYYSYGKRQDLSKLIIKRILLYHNHN